MEENTEFEEWLWKLNIFFRIMYADESFRKYPKHLLSKYRSFWFHVDFELIMTPKCCTGCDMHSGDLSSISSPYFSVRVICSWLIYDHIKPQTKSTCITPHLSHVYFDSQQKELCTFKLSSVDLQPFVRNTVRGLESR